MAIWQDLVSESGFNGGYQTVKRFVRKLRGNQPAQPRAVIVTARSAFTLERHRRNAAKKTKATTRSVAIRNFDCQIRMSNDDADVES
jgi:hypothetical protein